MKIIIPKRYAALTPIDIVVFLAGPVLGGGDWQRHLIEHFLRSAIQEHWDTPYQDIFLPSIRFVVPCRWGADHPLMEHFVAEYATVNLQKSGGYVIEAGQTVWEIEYLEAAIIRKHGLIVFGLFPESKEEPRTDGIPYATDTRSELARWTTIAQIADSANRIIVGAHPDFHLGAAKTNLTYFLGEEWVKSNMREIGTPAMLSDWVAEKIYNTIRSI